MLEKYKLSGVPSVESLIDGLKNRTLVSIKVINAQGLTERFVVCISKLGLSPKNESRMFGDINGFVVRINGQTLPEPLVCSAVFDCNANTGSFNLMTEAAKYSYEYFSALSDEQIRDEIADLHESLHSDLDKYESYLSTLSARDRLIIEALVVWKNISASMGVIMRHQIHQGVETRLSQKLN